MKSVSVFSRGCLGTSAVLLILTQALGALQILQSLKWIQNNRGKCRKLLHNVSKYNHKELQRC
jgi:hypothetical protein